MAPVVSQKVAVSKGRTLAAALAATLILAAGCGEDTTGGEPGAGGKGGKADHVCVDDGDCPQPYCLPGGPCPFYTCVDGQCVDLNDMAQEGETCGGFSPSPRQCALGLRCEVPQDGPTDAPGVCVRERPGTCQIDADCPQPYCLPGGPCPSFVCLDGQCVNGDDLAHEGETCGGFGPEPRRCAPGLRCEVPAVTQGPTDGPGVCVSDEVDTSCSVDADCPQPYCLPGGPCPYFVCVDGQCVDQNDLPAQEGETCGGFSPNPRKCAEGLKCEVPQDGPTDAPGVCVPEEPVSDCRTEGCPAGRYCTFCWIGYACIPEGALC